MKKIYIEWSFEMGRKLGISGNRLSCMQFINQFCVKKGSCFLSYNDFQDALNASRQTITSSLRYLVTEGWIETIGHKGEANEYQLTQKFMDYMNGALPQTKQPKRPALGSLKNRLPNNAGSSLKNRLPETSEGEQEGSLISTQTQSNFQTISKDKVNNIEFTESNSNSLYTCSSCLKEKEKEKENISLSSDILAAEAFRDWPTSCTQYERWRTDHFPHLCSSASYNWTQYPNFRQLATAFGEDKVAAAFARLDSDPSFAMAYKWEIDALRAIISDGK